MSLEKLHKAVRLTKIQAELLKELEKADGFVSYGKIQESLAKKGLLTARGEGARTGVLKILSSLDNKLKGTDYYIERQRGTGIRLVATPPPPTDESAHFAAGGYSNDTLNKALLRISFLEASMQDVAERLKAIEALIKPNHK